MNSIEEIQDHFIQSDSRVAGISFGNVRQSHQIQSNWNSLVVSAIEVAEKVNPYLPSLPDGTVVRAIDALRWPSFGHNCDIRPRLKDDSSGINRLVDSGSQISVAKKGPNDKIDDSFKLIAVNGSRIESYGVKDIELQIGRKTYKIPAVICDVQQDILGMDFINKYKLNFEWDDFDQTELYLVDKKANIKKSLQVVTVPNNTLRVDYLDSGNRQTPFPVPASPPAAGSVPPDKGVDPIDRARANEAIAFQISCIKRLDEKVTKKKSVEEQLMLHDKKYVKMIEAHPELLKPSFKKGEPAHGIYHRIETIPGHAPCKTKRRPIVMDSARAAAGKAAWDQMIEDGVVEQVKAGTNTDFSSALHLAPKPGGGARPCTDFRALNKMTIVDAHPLPLLKDFTGKIHGSKVFSVVDLRSAFFNVPIHPDHRHKTLTLSPWGGHIFTIDLRSGWPRHRPPGRSS